MKTSILGLFLFTSLAFAQHFSAGRATGGGNGGQTLYRGNVAYLRDLVEKNNCLWKNFDQILEEAPELNSVLDGIYKLNSSFGLRIEEEMHQLGYCFTTKRLPFLQYNNSDDIHIFANQEFDQVAINDSGIVFVDQNIFSTMDEQNKAYLFLHESAHELYDKNESRSSREPRLREFLMNVFDQLGPMVASNNTELFDYIIEQAKFTALEKITQYNKKEFSKVYMNAPTVSLAEKVRALKGLGLKVTDVTSPNPGTTKLYSEVLKESILEIEKARIEKINTLLTGTTYRTTKDNFSQLVKIRAEVSQYIYGDHSKTDRLNDAIFTIIESNDMSDNLEELKMVFETFDLQNTKVFYAGNIAKNYDAVYGQSTFLNVIAENSDYMNAILFGKVYQMKSGRFTKCKFMQGAGNGQCYSVRYIPYIQYVGKSELRNKEKGLVYDEAHTSTLMSYIMSELKYNKWLVKKFKDVLKADIADMERTKTSNFVISESTQIGDLLKKKKRYLRSWKLSGSQRRHEINLRNKLILTIENL